MVGKDEVKDGKERKPKNPRADLMMLLHKAGSEYIHNGHHNYHLYDFGHSKSNDEYPDLARRPGTAWRPVRPNTGHPNAARNRSNQNGVGLGDASWAWQAFRHTGMHQERPVARHGERGDVQIRPHTAMAGYATGRSRDYQYHHHQHQHHIQNYNDLSRIEATHRPNIKERDQALDAWMHHLGRMGRAGRHYKDDFRHKDKKKLTIDQQEAKNWPKGDKVLLPREQESAAGKLHKKRADIIKERVKQLRLRGYTAIGPEEELYFPDEEDLDRYVWTKGGKSLQPFERVELDEALHVARERAKLSQAAPGRADVAWRAHGKAAWVADCENQQHADYCIKHLQLGCKTAQAVKISDGVWGTRTQKGWSQSGKVISTSPRSKAKSGGGLFLDSMSRLRHQGNDVITSQAEGHIKEIAPVQKKQQIEVLEAPWKPWKEEKQVDKFQYSSEPNAKYRRDVDLRTPTGLIDARRNAAPKLQPSRP